MMTAETKRLWVVPQNDLEAVEVINLLRLHGETVLVSDQRWGASWEKLEPEVRAEIERAVEADPTLVVIGLELAGENSWAGETVDDHRWGAGDRVVGQTALTQVAEILGITLNRYQLLSVANDAGWIPALERAGASTGEIGAIRLADRTAQGVTPDQEAQAVADIANAEWQGDRALVRTSMSSFEVSPISDRLYGVAREWLICSANSWIYNGPRYAELWSAMDALRESRDWAKAPGDGVGYAGFVDVHDGTSRAEAILAFFWGS